MKGATRCSAAAHIRSITSISTSASPATSGMSSRVSTPSTPSSRSASPASAHQLRLDEFNPKVLGSFVRNQLIDEVYLPLVGDNLAKQIGAAGDGQAHRPDGPAAAHLAARLRQDDVDGVRRQPAGHRLRQDQRPGARPQRRVARSRGSAQRRRARRRSTSSTSRWRWATTR